jgi:hypothetical protein
MRERDEFRGFLPPSEPSGADDPGRPPTMADERDHPIEPVDLILRLSVSESGAAGGERLILFASLQSRIGRLHGPRPELLVLCRDGSGLPPPWITKSPVARRDIAWLKVLLMASGFPRRPARLVPARGRGRSSGRRRIELEVRMGDRARALEVALQPAGFSGPDAWLFGAVLDHVGELAEAAGRPMVRAVLKSLNVDRSAVDRWGRSTARVPAVDA